MGYLIAFIAMVLVMAVMMPKPNIENARAAKLGDFQFPRSKYGDAAPMLWGTVRQKSPVVAWYGDFTPVPISEKIKTGLFGSKSVITGYKNIIGIDCVLCLGPDVKLRKIWADIHEVWAGNISGGDVAVYLPELFGGDKSGGGLSGTFTFYDGGFSPAQSPYLVSKIGPNVPAYNGLCRVLFKSFYIGTSTTPKAFSFELSRITSGLHATYSKMPNGLDVNPMEIIYDAFTQKWGGFGNSPDVLDLPSLIACAQTLYSEGLGMSIMVQSAITGKDIVEEVVRVADAIIYQDPATAKIVAKLLRQDYVVADLLILDESSISSLKNFSKTTWDSTINQCRVTFKNRENLYDDSVAIAQDFANINFQQRVKSIEINVPGCSVPSVASQLATRQLSILSSPIYKCDIVVNRKAQALRPGAVFKLNWGPFGITNMIMRVVSIDFGDLTSNEISITCIQDRFASSLVTFASPEGSAWSPISTAASDVITRTLFTAPAFLAANVSTDSVSDFDNNGRLYVAAVGPSGASVSYDAMYSDDNFVTDPNLSINDGAYNGGGLLLNAYSSSVASVSRHDTSSTLVVTGMSAGAIAGLNNYSTLDKARDGSALLMIVSELFVYVGYIDNGGGQVTFPNVYRSVLDTAPEDHAAGDRVWVIRSADGLIQGLMPTGTTGYVKLLDNTTSSSLNISSSTTFSATVTNRAGLPLPPQYLTLNGSRTPPASSANSVSVSWRNRSREDTTLRVYDDAVSTREPGTSTVVRWRVGAGAYSEEITTLDTASLNVAGKSGLLEVIIFSRITSSGKESAESDTLTMTLS